MWRTCSFASWANNLSPSQCANKLPWRKERGAWTIEALAQRAFKAGWSQGLREPLRHDPHGVALRIDAVAAAQSPRRDRTIGVGEDGEAGPEIVPENMQVNGLQEGG